MAWMDNFISASDFDSIRLSVASRDDILNWSYGEVTKPETINYRTQKPERDGLFCERIFGPTKDINPHDSKLKGVRSREAAVDKEGNLVTNSITRRERMGHIALAAPVAHIWFMRGIPSALSLLLDITVKNIERVVYFATYLITDAKTDEIAKTLEALESQTVAARDAIRLRYEKESKADGADVKALAEQQTKELAELEEDYLARKSMLESFKKGGVITEVDYRNLPEEYEEFITVEMGATAIKKMLDEITVKPNGEYVTSLDWKYKDCFLEVIDINIPDNPKENEIFDKFPDLYLGCCDEAIIFLLPELKKFVKDNIVKEPNAVINFPERIHLEFPKWSFFNIEGEYGYNKTGKPRCKIKHFSYNPGGRFSFNERHNFTKIQNLIKEYIES